MCEKSSNTMHGVYCTENPKDGGAQSTTVEGVHGQG
jgi:hypothetical protein